MASVVEGMSTIIRQLQEAAASGVAMSTELKTLLEQPRNVLVDKVLDACLPNIWDDLSRLPPAHDSTDRGVYLHLFQTRDLLSKPWAYIGSSTAARGGVQSRVSQHRSATYRAAHPSYHYKKYEQFSNDFAIAYDNYYRVTNDSVSRDSSTVLFVEICLIAYFGVFPNSPITPVNTSWQGLNRSTAFIELGGTGQGYCLWRASQTPEVVAAQYQRANAASRRAFQAKHERAYESLTTVGLVVKLNRMGRTASPQPRSFSLFGLNVNIGKRFVEDLNDDTSKSLEARVILRGEGLDISYRSWSCRLEKQDLKPAVVQKLFESNR